jgi:hypothetical protein
MNNERLFKLTVDQRLTRSLDRSYEWGRKLTTERHHPFGERQFVRLMRLRSEVQSGALKYAPDLLDTSFPLRFVSIPS